MSNGIGASHLERDTDKFFASRNEQHYLFDFRFNTLRIFDINKGELFDVITTRRSEYEKVMSALKKIKSFLHEFETLNSKKCEFDSLDNNKIRILNLQRIISSLEKERTAYDDEIQLEKSEVDKGGRKSNKSRKSKKSKKSKKTRKTRK